VSRALAVVALLWVAPSLAEEPVEDVDSEQAAPDPTPPPMVIVPQPVPVPHDTRVPKRRIVTQVGVGASYSYAIGESFGAGALDVQFGAEDEHVAITFRAHADLGRSRLGLSFERISWGPSFLFKATSRWRLGFSPRMGTFIYQPPIPTRESIYSWQLGVVLTTSIDLIQDKGGRALVLWSDLGYDWMFMNSGSDLDNSAQHSAVFNVGVGYRF